ncbi:hypothetical protein VNI00_014156 [Paramarasmius palmivorus]|uniref:Uncharacterized protein n=1 Tax=Paramarasmius palmivorus TaxID=297713 RepID=A0AAW0BWN3_9AGAR
MNSKPSILDKVTLKYQGLKASLISPEDHGNAIQILKTDLGALKIPLPSNANISVVERGTIEFFWATTVNSTLDHTLRMKLQPQNEAEQAQLKETCRKLLMCSQTVFEKIVLDRQGQRGRRDSHKGPDLPPISNGTEKPVKYYANRSWTRTEPTQQEQVLQQEAQMFLDGIGEQMKMNDSGDSSRATSMIDASPPRALSTVLLILHVTTSRVDFFFADREGFRITGVNETSGHVSGSSSSFVLPCSLADMPVPLQTKPSMPMPIPIPIPMPENVAFSSHSNHNRTLSQSNIFSAASIPQSHSATLLPPQALTVTKPIPVSQDNVPKLLAELAEIRRQIQAGLEKEQAILDELKRLNAPNIPEASPSGMMSAGSELVYKTRLKMIEKQLDEERRRRKVAEEGLKDVERECREPFVVPALLEAFLTLSNMTTQVCEE